MNQTYSYFKDKFEDYKFKKYYKENIDNIFKENGIRLGIFKDFNNKKGIVINNKWCWRNTINTHPYCLVELNKIFIEMGNKEIDFSKNLDVFFEFISNNFDLLFTEIITTKYFNLFRKLCNHSWVIGQITTITFLYQLKNIFIDEKIKRINFSLERGDVDDFKGDDVIIYNNNNDKITFQIKSSNILYINKDGVCLKSSVNDFKSRSDYYVFVDIKPNLNNTEIILIQNFQLHRYVTKYNDGSFFFKNDIIYKNKISESMNISELLIKILQFSKENNYIFDINYDKSLDNCFDWVNNENEKIITLNISDFKDNNLFNIINNGFNELNNLSD